MLPSWTCRMCCKVAGRSFRYPPHPDVYCATCGEALSQREREVEVLRLLVLRPDSLLATIATADTAAQANEGPAPVTYTVEQAAQRLHCKRTKVFDLLKEGRLERAPNRAGRRTLITATSVEQLSSLPSLEPTASRLTASRRAPPPKQRGPEHLAAEISKIPV